MKEKKTRKEFDEVLQKDENLRKAFLEQCQKVAESGTCANDAEVLVKVADELGWILDLNELERERAIAEELDPEQLEKVAGGVEAVCFAISAPPTGEDEHGHDNWCMTLWHCLTVTMHTDSDDINHVCWSDYLCDFIDVRRYGY